MAGLYALRSPLPYESIWHTDRDSFERRKLFLPGETLFKKRLRLPGILLRAVVALSICWARASYAQAGCGAQCPEPEGRRFDVTDFGATPDDATDDDRLAFQAAIDRAATVSSGQNSCAIVAVPPGRYHFQEPTVESRGILLKSNVCLIGEDRDRTVIIGLVPMHVIGMQQIDGAAVKNLTIDNIGTTSSSKATHGIRLSDASNVLLQGLNIRNTYYYGIGFQGNGQFQSITVDDIDIRNTAADAIDFKNRVGQNSDILLTNINITDFGMARRSQAGIDVRGEVTMENINISGVRANQSGVRFRFTGSGDNGVGGVNSRLTDSKISGIAAGGIGVDVTNVGNVIESTIISGMRRQGVGIRIISTDAPDADTNTRITSVAMLNLDTGVRSSANGVTIDSSAFLANTVHLDHQPRTATIINSLFGAIDRVMPGT